MKRIDSGAVHIRLSTPDDHEELRSLVGELHDVVSQYDPDLAQTAEILDAYYQYILRTQHESQGVTFVAEEKGGLVGYVALFGLVAAKDVDELPDKFTVVSDLYVRPGAQRSGIGARLLARAEEYSRQLGAAKLELNVLARNRAAIEFYRRQAYSERVVTMVKRFNRPGDR
jgi:GNAT superfamily N-acetyltransferase